MLLNVAHVAEHGIGLVLFSLVYTARKQQACFVLAIFHFELIAKLMSAIVKCAAS